MKKTTYLPFVLLGSFALASNGVGEKEKTEKPAKTEKALQCKKTASSQACVPVTYSCGATGTACGKTVMDMVKDAWDGDNQNCP
ncbi:hypothetical protein [Ornithobacterium rhinotracheale]